MHNSNNSDMDSFSYEQNCVEIAESNLESIDETWYSEKLPKHDSIS